MSTPGTGSTDGERRAAHGDGPRHSDAQDNPTELMDTGGTGSTGASAAGAGSDGDARGASAVDGTTGRNRGDADYSPGAYSSDDDTSGDYVPGMYSDDSDSSPSSTREEAAPTRRQSAPITASRDSARTDATASHDVDDTRTRAHTQAVPVTATRDAGADQHDRSHRLPNVAAGTAGSGVPSLEDRKLLHQREKEHFGGMKFGSAFFGWLTATGLFVLLSAVAGGIAALFGYGANLSTSDLTSGSSEAQTMGITAAVVFGVILLISYFAGGYVAGRMARFSGAKQGVAVWLWAVIVALVLTLVGFIVGNQAGVAERFQGIGVPAAQDLSGPGLIGLLVVAAIALVGAILGGLTGMRYHRRIDRTDFDALDDAR